MNFRLFLILLGFGAAFLQGMEQKFTIQQLPQDVRLEICKNLKSSRTRYIDIVAFFKALQTWRCTCKEWNIIAQNKQIQDLCTSLKKLVAENSKSGEQSGKTLVHDVISRLSADHTVSPETLIQLLEAGANINKSDKLGETPLYYTAARDQKELAQILLDYGADINQAGNKTKIQHGWTPLHMAAKNGWKGMVQFLLAHGADVTKTTNHKKTAFALAFEKNHTEIANLLAEAEKEQEKKQQEKKQQATTEPDESRLQKIMKLTKNIFGKK